MRGAAYSITHSHRRGSKDVSARFAICHLPSAIFGCARGGVVKTSVTHLGQHMGNTFVPSWLLFLFLIPPKGESDLRMFLGLRFRSRAVPKRGSADTSRSAERQFAARVVAPGTRFGAPGFGTDRPFMRPPGWRPTPSAQSSASVPPVAPTATGQTTRCVYLPRPAPILPTIPPALQK